MCIHKSVGRAIKLVSDTSVKVCNYESKQGFIRSGMNHVVDFFFVYLEQKFTLQSKKIDLVSFII